MTNEGIEAPGDLGGDLHARAEDLDPMSTSQGSTMSRLFVFKGDCDHVVARDEEDAWEVWCESTGEIREDYEEQYFELCPDDKTLSIWTDDHDLTQCSCQGIKDEFEQRYKRIVEIFARLPRPARVILAPALPAGPDTYPNGHVVGCHRGAEVKTCRQWAEENGRDFLCSTEF